MGGEGQTVTSGRKTVSMVNNSSSLTGSGGGFRLRAAGDQSAQIQVASTLKLRYILASALLLFCVSQIHKSPLLHVPAPIPHIHNGNLCLSQPQHHTYTNVHFCVSQIHKSPLLHVPAPIPHIHNNKLCISQPHQLW